jgi:hypothetical protein
MYNFNVGKKVNNQPMIENSPNLGSITIFCVFCQFSAKKLAFFSKINAMIIFSEFRFVLSQKRQSAPGHPDAMDAVFSK